MKTLLFSLYFGFFFLINLSKTDNFSIENGQLIWQKVYSTELSKEQLIMGIRNSGKFKNISLYGDNVIAEISDLSIEHKKSPTSPASSILAIHNINSYVIIDLKDKKYRVTLKSIKLIRKTNFIEFADKIFDIETIALNKDTNTFSDKFLKRTSKKMDSTFQKITDFNRNIRKDTW